MKKIMMVIFTLIIIFSVKNVFAQDQYKLTLEKQSGIYFSRHGENFNDDSYPYYLYRFGNIYAYCLQPGKHFKTYEYVGVNNFINLSFSEEILEKLELIGYYGRDYPGHDNIRYSMATQALIWELTGVDTVTFWTQQYEKGTEIDVTSEKNEIMKLVNEHKSFPNIGKSIIGDMNKEIVINDTNKLLEKYEIENNGGNEVEIIDNTIRIVPKVIGESIISLKYKKYDDTNTIIFIAKDNSDSQILGRLRFSTDKKMDIKLSTKGTKLMVNKRDDDGNLIKKAGIRFKIKNKENNEYLCENDTCEYLTNDNGVFVTDYLEYGEYEIEELENDLLDYVWNKEKLKVSYDKNTILEDNNDYNYISVNFVNEKVKGNIEIYKKGEEVFFQDNEIIYKKNNLANIEFSLYNEQDKLIDTIKTNNNGYAKYTDLPVGKYYLKEKSKLDNYVLNDDKIYFEIKKENNKGNSIRLNIDNYLKKGKLVFSKEDLVTSEGIPNTIIEIYDKADNLILTEETDSNGSIIIDQIPCGRYYIIEKEANANYQITNEKVYFEIKENGEIVKAKMTNEKVVIDVPKTDTKEGIIVHFLFGIGFMIGLIRFYYERKETV